MASTDPRLSGLHASADDLPELPVHVRVDIPLSLSADRRTPAPSRTGAGRHRRPPAPARAPHSDLRQAVTVGVTAATLVLGVLSGALIATQLLLH